MSLHKQLIGTHPVAPNIFDKWLNSNDIESTEDGCHRSLTHKVDYDDEELIDWLSKKLIHHHYDENRLRRLKNKFSELGFPEYAKQHRRLPIADRTKKGNATEIILIEYIESCQAKPLVKAYKLRYNPNVDQAIKGDDTLLIDIIQNDKGESDIKMFLGEAKFRKKPTKKVVEDISEALGKDKLPLSYSYLVDELGRNSETEELADLLDSYLIQEIKDKGNISYTGFLLSNSETFKFVDANLKTDNKSLIFISLGMDEPELFINKAFEKAEEHLLNPESL